MQGVRPRWAQLLAAALLAWAMACVTAGLQPMAASAAQVEVGSVAAGAVGSADSGAAMKATAATKVTLYFDSATQASKTLKAKGLKAAKATWKSTKPKVATVKKGKVTAKKAGKTTITAKQGKKTFKFTVTVKKVAISAKSVSLQVGGSSKLALKGDKIKAAKSSAPKVASVSKAGAVKALTAGKSTITLTSKKGKKYTCTVTVKGAPAKAPAQPATVAVSGIAFQKATLSFVVGDAGVSNPASVSPANATNKKVTYESSNKSVATVDDKGFIKPVAAGSATITATSADGGKKATCKVTVAENAATVTTAQALKDALNSGKVYDKLTLNTQESGEIVLESSRDLSKTDLVINAPNATIENSVNYKSVTINAIADNTYRERGNNAIHVAAPNSHIVVMEGSRSTVSARPQVRDMHLENHGRIDNLTVETAGRVRIEGSSQQSGIKTEVKKPATIETHARLIIEAIAKAILVLQPGSEGTTAKVNNEANVPEASGIGAVETTITNGNGSVKDVSTVVATYNDEVASSDDVATVGKVEGRVLDGSADDDDSSVSPIEGAAVTLYRFGSDQPYGDPATTDSDGKFSFENLKAGNYTFKVQKDGYDPTTQDQVLDNSEGDRSWGDVYLLREGATGQGSVSGQVIDATQEGNVGIGGITLRVRMGAGNLTGEVVARAATDDNGNYAFEGLAPGIYTIQATDMRAEQTHYISTSVNVTVKADKSATKEISMTPGIDGDGLQFVLRWRGDEEGVPADIDSHLYGPADDGGLFHTYFVDMSYRSDDEVVAFLDRDDTDYEGPETTTVHRLNNGTYTFFVHDYTNLEKTSSTALGNSGAYVEVYSGSGASQRFNVPAGREGTVWAVCSYNPKTKEIKRIDEMSYESEPIAVGADYLHGGLKITDVAESDFVKEAQVSSGTINLTIAPAKESELRAKLEAVALSASEGGKAQVYYDEDAESYYAKVVSADGATTRTYRVEYTTDWGDLAVYDIEVNDQVEKAEIESTEIYVYAKNPTFEGCKDYVKPLFDANGITYELTQADEDNDAEAVLSISDGTYTRTYRVHFQKAWGDLRITGFDLSGQDQVVDYKIPTSFSSNWIDVYCVETSFAAYKDKLKPVIEQLGATYVVETDEGDDPVIKITSADGKSTRTYWLDVYKDAWDGLRVSGFEKNSVLTDYWIDNDGAEIGLSLTDTEFSTIKSSIRPTFSISGITYEFIEGESGDDGHKLVLSKGGNTRTFNVYPSRDWQGLQLDGFEKNSVVTGYDIDTWDATLYVTDFSYGALEQYIKPIIGKDDADFDLIYDGDESLYSEDDEASLDSIVIKAAGVERPYRLYVQRDWQDMYVESIETNDAVLDYRIYYGFIDLCVADTDVDTWLDKVVAHVAKERTACRVEPGEADEGNNPRLVLADGSGNEREYTLCAYDSDGWDDQYGYDYDD